MGMKKYIIYMKVLFFLFIVDYCYCMTTVNRLNQRTSSVLGRRGYGFWSSRAAEQAIQAEKSKNAEDWLQQENRKLDEYFKKRPDLLNSDVFNRRPTISDIPGSQAVSLTQKTDLSWFEKIKNAIYYLLGPSREAQAEKFKAAEDWWQEQKKE